MHLGLDNCHVWHDLRRKYLYVYAIYLWGGVRINTKHKYCLLMRGMKIESHKKFIFERNRSIYFIFTKSGSYSNSRFECYHYVILVTRAAQRVTTDGAPVFRKISMRILFKIRAESIISIVTSEDLKPRCENRISHFLIHNQNYYVSWDLHPKHRPSNANIRKYNVTWHQYPCSSSVWNA